MCKYLHQQGHRTVVLDNLTQGHRHAIKWGPFYQGNLDNRALLRSIFSEQEIAAVMHFAAFCYVGESVLQPTKYYENNVSATVTLLDEMIKNKITKFIFSPTCATYGNPDRIPIGASKKARDELNWKPQFSDIETILKTAWEWGKKNPCGYLTIKAL